MCAKLWTIVLHILSWCTHCSNQHPQQGNSQRWEVFWSSILCLVEMDLMKNVKKQSWRPRRWLCRLLPELQMCKFHAWWDSGKTHIHHPAARTPMYSMINLIIHITTINYNCFVTLSRVCMCFWVWTCSLVCLAILVLEDTNPPTRQNESGVQLILFNTITSNLNHSEG